MIRWRLLKVVHLGTSEMCNAGAGRNRQQHERHKKPIEEKESWKMGGELPCSIASTETLSKQNLYWWLWQIVRRYSRGIR